MGEASMSNNHGEEDPTSGPGPAPEDEDDRAADIVQHSVTHASYPIPQPLSRILQASMIESQSSAGKVKVQTEDAATALGEILENALQSVDALYFSTPPKVRALAEWKHRTCLRISTDSSSNTLTICDLGMGMTRADLINMLGVGRPLASSASAFATSKASQTSDGEDEAEISTSESISCKKNVIGGFYSALCALGVGVRVGTKSKFDDYYEFEVGRMDASSSGSVQEFVIKRPMEEGVKPTVANGFDQLGQVRGDSGTSVTIHLQPKHYSLLETDVLLPMVTKLMERSPYTFCVAGATSEEEQQSIINATQKEQEAIEALNRETSQDDAVEDIDPKDHAPLSYTSVKERAKYIPLRLSLNERKMLRLVEASMNCCDYTSEVDAPFKNPARRMHQQMKGINNVLRGLVTACDYSAGAKLAAGETNFSDYQKFLCQMLEIARRHKIMNPEKMRTEYGKLIYLLQDSVSLQEHLGFSVNSPIETVYKFLEERNGLALLEDGLIERATEEILALKKSRAQIDNDIRRKEQAVSALKRKHKSSQLSMEDIHLCLYSICDNNSFLNSNRVPIDKVITFLQTHFSPSRVEDGYSLSIVSGQDGARLSHNHERQYYFALQSLTLWRDIVDDMFRLWAMAEEDLLSNSVGYSLQDTGQGMQRVQQSPRTYKAMQQILVRVQGKVQHWVGSSVIHLGDHNVPNSLSFIDKYTQVPRILGPIVICLENLEKICEKDAEIEDMINEGFGGLETLRKDILYDFFRSAFDGSGADNFYDAGSCIDGRMTSAWNWCSQLPSKPFYPIFKLTGFVGFDGEFK